MRTTYPTAMRVGHVPTPPPSSGEHYGRTPCASTMAPVSRPTRPHPPAPVIAALSFLVALCLGDAVIALLSDTRHIVVSTLIAVILQAALVYRLWRGGRLAFGLMILLAAGSLAVNAVALSRGFDPWRVVEMAGVLTVALLLLVPESSRRWFPRTPPARFGTVNNPSPDTDALREQNRSG